MSIRNGNLSGVGTPVRDDERKRIETARAMAALHGILAEPSRDEHGRRTIILTRGAWTREVLIDQLADALARLKAVCA